MIQDIANRGVLFLFLFLHGVPNCLESGSWALHEPLSRCWCGSTLELPLRCLIKHFRCRMCRHCKINFNWSLFDFMKDCLPSLCPWSLTHKWFFFHSQNFSLFDIMPLQLFSSNLLGCYKCSCADSSFHMTESWCALLQPERNCQFISHTGSH